MFSNNQIIVGEVFNVTQPNQIILNNLSNVTFSKCHFIGPSIDTNVLGPSVKDGKNITFEDCEFTKLYMGLIHGQNLTGLRVVNCHFHDIRSDGIHGASSDILIESCRFENFHKHGTVQTGGDHSDAIQFDNHDSVSSIENITIKGNTFTQGMGTAFQGIFIKDETQHLPYRNVRILSNKILGGDPNAIWVHTADGLTVSNNYVLGIRDHPTVISLRGENIIAKNNKAESFQFGGLLVDPSNQIIS